MHRQLCEGALSMSQRGAVPYSDPKSAPLDILQLCATVATNVKYALSKHHIRCANPRRTCLWSMASWERWEAIFTLKRRGVRAQKGSEWRMAHLM